MLTDAQFVAIIATDEQRGTGRTEPLMIRTAARHLANLTLLLAIGWVLAPASLALIGAFAR